jgi:hypothetical protein
MIVDAQSRHRQVFVIGLRANVQHFLATQGVLKHITEDKLFVSRLTALQAATNFVENLLPTHST